MIENKTNKELERKIDLYINGGLDAEEVDELWEELIQDEYYLDYMKSAANLKALVERKKADAPASKIHSFGQVARYAAAAAVILIATVLGVLNVNTGNDLSVSPLSDIGLDVVRSTDGISETVTNDVIKQAIRLATDGQVNEAVQLLNSELEATENGQEKAEIALSLGSIQYNNGNYLAAVESFEKVTSQNEIEVLTLEKGYWYLGNAYFQLDQLERAEQAFQHAYELNGAYSRVAKTYVDALAGIAEVE